MLNKDKDYHSYSSIKRFIREGPSSLITESNYKNKGMSKGILLEDMLTLPNFEDEYYVSEIDLENLTPMENKMLQAKIERPGKSYDYLRDDLNYFKSDNDDSFKERVKKIDKFYESNKDSRGKKLVKKDLWLNIFTMSNALKEDNNTSLYFNNDNLSKRQNMYRKTIEFEFEGIKFKCILDIIHIDHENKTVQAVDLKYTSSRIIYFEDEFFKYRYDIQSTIYTKSLKSFIEDNNLDGYSVIEPAYVVVNDSLETCRFIIDERTMRSSWLGFNRKGYSYPGIKETISIINWHKKNNEFSKSYEYSGLGYSRIRLENTPIYGSNVNFSEVNFKSEIESSDEESLINSSKSLTSIIQEYKQHVEKLKNCEQPTSNAVKNEFDAVLNYYNSGIYGKQKGES